MLFRINMLLMNASTGWTMFGISLVKPKAAAQFADSRGLGKAARFHHAVNTTRPVPYRRASRPTNQRRCASLRVDRAFRSSPIS